MFPVVIFHIPKGLREILGLAMDIREHDVVISIYSVKVAVVDHG